MTDKSKLTYYEDFIYKSRYARWREDLGRRENWNETVDRLMQFWLKRVGKEILDVDTYNELYNAIYNLEVMPSMRTLMTAGEALERDHVAGYNCAAVSVQGRGKELSLFSDEMKDMGFDEPINIQIKNPIVFDEIFYILLCGTGVGYSVERQYVNELPTVGKPLNRNIYRRTNNNFFGVPKEELSYIDRKRNKIIVQDSKYGWASALRILIVENYNGNHQVSWDTSSVRPVGATLKTFGGRASGPLPLIELFNFAQESFAKASKRKLTSLEVHSLVCKIASIVVVGGVRRSALISLSNLSDDRMRRAKSGDWWNTDPHFALANNSAVYTERPDAETFLREWTALVESKSGERGIFNRQAAANQVEKTGRRDSNYFWLCNPCSEIILRDSGQFCNLSEAIIREKDTFDSLKRKVRLAAILGTLQSTLTNFRYLNPTWKFNTEEERLLGVSLTGVMDHPAMSGLPFTAMQDWESFYSLGELLNLLKEEVVKTNVEWAEKLNISPSKATTCVKPSGTVSQRVNSSSGLHARHAPYVLRAVRNDIKDPITSFLIDAGIPHEPDLTTPTNIVFYFPIKSPKSSVFRNDLTAIEQLEIWEIYQDHWCEHKPSVTITVKDDEWMEVGAWVYKHFDSVSGISFLPHTDHIYKQAPYQELTEEEYKVWVKTMPKTIDWNQLAKYENEDKTIGSQEYACSGGSCELV